MWVVVLGDFGRSPRMQNHALSLAQQVVVVGNTGLIHASSVQAVLSTACMCDVLQAGLMVDVLAFGGSQPSGAIAGCQNIHIHCIPEAYGLNWTAPGQPCTVTAHVSCDDSHTLHVRHRWRCLSLLPRTLALVAKAAQQALLLLGMMLFWLPSPDLLLLQVKTPAMPQLPRLPAGMMLFFLAALGRPAPAASDPLRSPVGSGAYRSLHVRWVFPVTQQLSHCSCKHVVPALRLRKPAIDVLGPGTRWPGASCSAHVYRRSRDETPLLPCPQVPPAIPTLPLCWLACAWHGATFMIDWHNFAYTLMALSMTRRHPLVTMSPAPHAWAGCSIHARSSVHDQPLTACLAWAALAG